jgi:hypothetical protein
VCDGLTCTCILVIHEMKPNEVHGFVHMGHRLDWYLSGADEKVQARQTLHFTMTEKAVQAERSREAL